MMILQDVWNAVGGLLAVVLAIEILPGLWKRLSRRIRYGGGGKADYRASAEAYEGADWTAAYYEDIWSLRIDWAPHVGGVLRPCSTPYFNVDGKNHRRTWNAAGEGDKGPRARVFAFGGSTMLGMGVRDDETVPSILARKLDAKGIRAEVTNFGQPSYTARQAFIAFSEELARGNVPDVAIFLDGLNEAIAAEQKGRAGGVFNESNREEEFNILQPWRRGDLLLKAMAAAFPRTSRRLSGLFGPAPTFEFRLTRERLEPLGREVADLYANTIRQARTAAADNGVGSLFFWQPSLFSKKKLSPHEDRYQNDGAPVPDLRRPLFQGIYETVKSNPDFKSMPEAVDISGLFDDSPEPWFIDPFHLAGKGNEIIVDAMLPHVVAALEKSSGGSV